MALTPKQQRFVEEVMARKAHALRMICRHIGMLPLTPEVQERNRAKMPDRVLVWSIWALVAPIPRWQRQMATLALDLVSPNWREVAGPEIMGMNVERDDPLVRKWRKEVIANDNSQCRHCGATESLHAHHIVRWADDPSLRLDPTNGMTLCRDCHAEEHRRYG